ncbi:hypothetical protein B0T14DRAFT_567559 [Immersiella caudata]|uniref:Alpha-ketoglutarate-dependent dioxygenase AlkB-like domain-containing protein n=1 Tax=Immersiella caudata TaxID=314043 RepID=A0AA40C0H5_9PEZI|nr:hypothetical protein B0T14DRAFT_567559 [Immersiella caudata]
MPNDTMDATPPEVLQHLEDNVRAALTATAAKTGSNTGPDIDDSPRFNGALLIGNYPGHGMNWHSDDEKGLVGDGVASISLGLASMSFAIKHKYNTERLHRGTQVAHVDDTIVKGALKEDERRQIQAQFMAGSLPKEEATKQLTAVAKSLGAISQRDIATVLKFSLSFGAIMVQKRPSLNEMYIHKVELAKGELGRFVLTGGTLASQKRDHLEGLTGRGIVVEVLL